MDIIVTTPKKQMENAAKEAAAAIAGEVKYYFRVFSCDPIHVGAGDKVFYTENGYIRGYAVVHSKYPCNSDGTAVKCDTTNQNWKGSWVIYMRCDSWKWIEPLKMKGFQGHRYIHDYSVKITNEADWSCLKRECFNGSKVKTLKYKIVGGWLDPKPECN